MMPTRPSHGSALARVLGGAGAIAACVPMVAMLPGGVASAFAVVGLGAGTGAAAALSTPLSPVAQPLLLVATALVAVSQLRCSRLAVASATAGGVLVYLGMYTITQPNGRSTPTLFYPGLALFIGSYLIPIVRRRLGRCRPVVGPRLATTLLLATLAAGAIAVASAAAFQGAPRATPAHTPAAPHTTPSHGSKPGMSMER